MNLRLPLTSTVLALLVCGAMGTTAMAAEGAAAEAPKAAQVETATAVGVVSAVNSAKHSFTLKEDGSGKDSEYRAYFRDGNPEKMLARIAKLAVGDHLTVVYTEREGRRALKIELVHADAQK